MLAVLGLTLATAGCRWPELLRARLLAEGGTYLLGATFGQRVVGPDGQPSLSPGIVIWTGDDNASALMAPVGGTLEWSPGGAQCPPPPTESESQCGVLRLTPRPTGEGEDGEEGELRARTDLIVHVIQFEGMDRDSVVAAIAVLAADPKRAQDASTLFTGGFGVEPGDPLGQAVRVESDHWKAFPNPGGGDAITLTRRVLLTVSAAEEPAAYLDPYLFFPEDVAVLGAGHESLLGDVTPPELTGHGIALYPQSADTSVVALVPTNPGDPVPQYEVEQHELLDLGVLVRDQGAGVCSGEGCLATALDLGVKSITYYVIDEAETGPPLIGPVTVNLRCLDKSRFTQQDPADRIYRAGTAASPEGNVYDVTAMRSRGDACAALDAGDHVSTAPDPQTLAIDTGLLSPEATYTLVVVVEDFAGNLNGVVDGGEGDAGSLSAAPGLPSGPEGDGGASVAWLVLPPGAGSRASLRITAPNLAPVAVISPRGCFPIDPQGFAPEDMVIDGSRSHDADVPVPPRADIANYTWSVSGPPGCFDVPGPISGADKTKFTVFRQGYAVDPDCLGDWQVSLTVNDGDAPPKEHTAEADFRIAIVEPPVILTSSETLLRFPHDASTTDTLDIHYSGSCLASSGELRWTVYRSGGEQAGSGAVLGATSPDGTLAWDGRVNGSPLAPGDYQFELGVPRGDSGPTVATSARHAFQVYRLDLDVDTDRDGAITAADEPGEADWTPTRGAIFAVNYDADGGHKVDNLPIPDAIYIGDDGVPADEDLFIDGKADEDDITPLLLRSLGIALPTGYSVHLRTASPDDIRSIHVFKAVDGGTLPGHGEKAIWGGWVLPQPQVVDIKEWVDYTKPPTADRQFGLEGLFFRSQGVGAVNPFDGEIDLTLELRKGATVIASDSVRMKVAPWIMLPHTQPSEQVWVADVVENLVLRLTLSNGLGILGPNQLHTESEVSRMAYSTWFQDHVEMGQYQRPGGPEVKAVFRMPYDYTPGHPQPTWPQYDLLSGNTVSAADTATFQVKQKFYEFDPELQDSTRGGDYGGNLELMPSGSEYPVGRLVIGDTISSGLLAFLTSQEVQGPPLPLPTQWLYVGHIDEVFGFTGTKNGDGRDDVVVASPHEAYQIMEAIPEQERARHVFFARGEAIPAVGIVAGSASNSQRVLTDHDYYTGSDWKYIRIISDADSGAAGQDAESDAAGQVAFITGGGGSSSEGYYIEIGAVWDIPKDIVPHGLGEEAYATWASWPARKRAGWWRPPGAGDRFVLVQDTRFWFDKDADGYHGTPAFITVEEVLADSMLKTLNIGYVQPKIDAIKESLNGARGRAQDGTPKSPLNFIAVPVVFFESALAIAPVETEGVKGCYVDSAQRVRCVSFDNARTVRSMTPNLANFQAMTVRPNPANPQAYEELHFFPRVFGPRTPSTGVDLFESVVRSRIPTARFADVWDLYHRLSGEVHCASAVVRTARPNWWSPSP